MWSISVSGSGSVDIVDNEVDSRHMAALSGQPSFVVTVCRLKSVGCRYLLLNADIFEFS